MPRQFQSRRSGLLAPAAQTQVDDSDLRVVLVTLQVCFAANHTYL